MNNPDFLTLWQTFNCYMFEEDSHTYFYNGKRVKFSVTQFISRFFEEFDSDTIAERYAKKHGLDKDEVLKMWEKSGKVSSTSGTIIHNHLENLKRGKRLKHDFSKANEFGIREEVEERVRVLLPKAEAFHKDTINKLYPLQMEYTVGYEDFLAGNIDLVYWNEFAKEIQIWDYKNVKELSMRHFHGHCCKYPFNQYQDCNYIHYCIQLNIYKYLLKSILNIDVGDMYLVHFNYQKEDDSFEVVKCIDLQAECAIAIDMLIKENGYLDET